MTAFFVRLLLALAIEILKGIKARYERLSPEQKQELARGLDEAWRKQVEQWLDPNRESDR